MKNIKTTAAFLRKYNAWRRGADIDQPDPAEVGKAIDRAIKFINSTLTKTKK